MSLPVRTSTSDIEKICAYLHKQPAGIGFSDAKAALGGGLVDVRKIAALKYWHLVVEESEKLKLTKLGRMCAIGDTERQEALRDVIKKHDPYFKALEHTHYKKTDVLTSADVGAYWHDHFRSVVSGSNRILNDQAICFFQIATGAGLGRLVIGRRGQATRFQFETDELLSFIQSCDEDDENDIGEKFGENDTEGDSTCSDYRDEEKSQDSLDLYNNATKENGILQDVCNLSGGRKVVLTFPRDFTKEDYEDTVSWLEWQSRRLERWVRSS